MFNPFSIPSERIDVICFFSNVECESEEAPPLQASYPNYCSRSVKRVSMWSGKKKKNGSAEELAEETGTEKEKRKKDDKKKRDEETKESAGLFQRKSRKNTGVDADGQRPKERSVRMLHRRNKSSSASPADSAVVGGASKPTTPQSLSPNPEHGDLTRLGIKRESLSLSLNNPLLSSYPPPNTSPRSEGVSLIVLAWNPHSRTRSHLNFK